MTKLEQAISKLQKCTVSRPSTSFNKSPATDEYNVLAQHITGQLRQLPVRSLVVLQEKIQFLITAEWLNNMASQSPLSACMATSPMLSGTESSNFDHNSDDEMREMPYKFYTARSNIYENL